ncbi:MAG TPA: hypothetical protein VFW96_14785 [Thermomicrobiales bacterium]|nr:hypothetical protein [Thermomicrobiales bacterium]
MTSSPRYQVPKEEYLGLSKLLHLPDVQTQELMEAIQSTSPTLLRRDFIAHVAPKTGIPYADAREILNVLLTLYGVYSDSELPPTQFVDAIAQALREAEEPSTRPENEDLTLFKERLLRFLSLDQSLGITGKALYVFSQHEHTVHSFEVFTDVRPIFGSDIGVTPAAAVITHNLKVTYHEGDGLAEFFVALRPPDIVRLRKVLDRADRKAKTLTGLLEAAKIPELTEGR